jgi:hypothetical protein
VVLKGMGFICQAKVCSLSCAVNNGFYNSAKVGVRIKRVPSVVHTHIFSLRLWAEYYIVILNNLKY